MGSDRPVTGERLNPALANMAVSAITSTLDGEWPKRPEAKPRQVGYCNPERNPEFVAGKLRLAGPALAAAKRRFYDRQVEVLHTLLTLLHDPPAR